MFVPVIGAVLTGETYFIRIGSVTLLSANKPPSGLYIDSTIGKAFSPMQATHTTGFPSAYGIYPFYMPYISALCRHISRLSTDQFHLLPPAKALCRSAVAITPSSCRRCLGYTYACRETGCRLTGESEGVPLPHHLRAARTQS